MNPSQEQAVKSHGHQLILAGPGSGKTRVITEKILHLLDQGINPGQILALTFSEKAAKEMLERTDTRDGTISTFHSFCNAVLEEGRVKDIQKVKQSFPGSFLSFANTICEDITT